VQFYGGIVLASSCGLFMFPLLILIYVQVGNFMLNQTTYERFSQQSEAVRGSGSCTENCSEMCYVNENRKSFVFQTDETLLI
jgi:hypothetical protein